MREVKLPALKRWACYDEPALRGSRRSSLLQQPGLAGPFDRTFARCGLTPERRGGRQGHTRSHICEKFLMLLARTAPGQSLHRIWTIKASSLMVFVGSYPDDRRPRFQQHGCHADTERSSVCQPRALNPGLKAGARRAIRSPSAAIGSQDGSPKSANAARPSRDGDNPPLEESTAAVSGALRRMS